MDSKTTVIANDTEDAIRQVEAMHPGCVVEAWQTNVGWDVLVWTAQAVADGDAENDDGAHAIARYAAVLAS
jgi:hypothetical protein